jgi:hypothetical protein
MKKSLIYLFWIAILLGLFIRYLSLSYNGIFDMEVYHRWGLATLKVGLSSSFQGTYLPFQYQIFELGAFLTLKFNTDYSVIYKLVNLFFDIGNLIVLFFILKKFNLSKFYLLIYWLHPWFLLMFSQGYCDFQFTFFILCTILFSFRATSRSYLAAGIFFGLAFLMKPQVQIVFLALFIYGLYVYYKEKDLKLLHLFVFPSILFIDYSLYFFIKSGNPFRLLRTYVDLGHGLALTANFLNGWFPVAYYLKAPQDPIYSVTDNIPIPNINLRMTAIVILVFLICLFIRKIYKANYNQQVNYNLFLVACFSTFIFPFVMISAHENHLFLATVLLIPVLAKVKNVWAKVSIHLLLLLQFINLYGYYGYGENKFFATININYTYKTAFVLSLMAFFAFLILVSYFLSPKSALLAQFMNAPKNEKIEK